MVISYETIPIPSPKKVSFIPSPFGVKAEGHTHTHTQTQTHTHKHTNTNTLANPNTHTYTHTHTRLQTHIEEDHTTTECLKMKQATAWTDN